MLHLHEYYLRPKSEQTIVSLSKNFTFKEKTSPDTLRKSLKKFNIFKNFFNKKISIVKKTTTSIIKKCIDLCKDYDFFQNIIFINVLIFSFIPNGHPEKSTFETVA